jgi:hypothetical protein
MRKNEGTERLKKNAPMSLKEYLALNSEGTADADRLTSNALYGAAVADTSYGALGERLTSSGLAGGGYEEFIKSQNASTAGGALARADEARMRSEADTKRGYSAYVSDYERLQEKISDAVIKHFAATTVFDINEAYRYALGAGLSGDGALITAARAVKAARDNTVEYVIRLAIREDMSPKKARRYAEQYGLDKRYLDKIYDSVAKLTDEEKRYFSGMSAEDLMKHIEKQNKNRKDN